MDDEFETSYDVPDQLNQVDEALLQAGDVPSSRYVIEDPRNKSGQTNIEGNFTLLGNTADRTPMGAITDITKAENRSLYARTRNVFIMYGEPTLQYNRYLEG